VKDEEFEGSTALKYWLDSLKGNEASHSTKYVWKHHLKRFCNWAGKTPDQLVEERKRQLESEDKRVQHQAETRVKEFLKALEDRGMAANTRGSYFMAVRNFYKRNYQELYFFRGDGPGNETSQEGVRAASKEDICKMLEVSNPRTRSLILFIKDTGLAECDVAKLKLKDLGVDDVSRIFSYEPPVPLIARRQKTKRRTITFIGKEGWDALKTSLRLRQQGSPELKIRRYNRDEQKPGLLPETLTLDSPLFRSYEKFFARATLARKDMAVQHLSPHAISVIIRKAAISAGIWKEGFSAHALRRFFQTSLETSGMNANWIRKMMGHALNGSEAPYSQPEVSMLREAYVRAYAHLAVSEAVEQKSRVQALESQVEALIMNGKTKDLKIEELQTRQLGISEKADVLEKLLKRVEELEKHVTK
jgi:site-specific recombinase XerD